MKALNLVNINNYFSIMPDSWHVSQRLNQLAQVYSKPRLRACILVKSKGLQSKNKDLELHVNNLVNTYGRDVFNDMSLIILGVSL